MIESIIVIIFAYFIGAIPSGFIIGKCHGVDIRTVGSCNTGATNVTRCIGKKAGILCFVCDFLKGALPVLAARCLAPFAWVEIAAFAVAVAGHMFPVYLKFKGGKGIATAAGGAFAIAPLPLLAALVLWYILFRISRYVSLASIVAAVALPVGALVLHLVFDPVKAHALLRVQLSTVIAFAVIGALAVYRHRSNIVRLLNGTESRFEKKK
jgi:glycerol-3-phosphate acyltransferase PlsY